MATTTAIHGLPVPEGTDAPNVPLDVINLADAVDVLLMVVSTSAPASAGAGMGWWDPSTGQFAIYDGSTWDYVLQDTGWLDIDLHVGSPLTIIAGSPVPQVRLYRGVIYYQGLVQPSGGGNFPTGAVLAIGNLPDPITPGYKINVPISGNAPAADGRGIHNTDQTISIVTGTTGTLYYDLAGMSGHLPN